GRSGRSFIVFSGSGGVHCAMPGIGRSRVARAPPSGPAALVLSRHNLWSRSYHGERTVFDNRISDVVRASLPGDKSANPRRLSGRRVERRRMRTTEATDFDIARLRARRTNKWHKFPPDVVPAWVADRDFGVAPSIPAAVARLTRDQEFGYAARDGVLAAAFVRRMERRFGWHTDPADTIAIGDLVQATFSSVMAFSEPGDAILLQLPSYPPFMRAIEDTGRRLIANPMRDDGTRWVLDWAPRMRP